MKRLFGVAVVTLVAPVILGGIIWQARGSSGKTGDEYLASVREALNSWESETWSAGRRGNLLATVNERG